MTNYLLIQHYHIFMFNLIFLCMKISDWMLDTEGHILLKNTTFMVISHIT
jgi:hypothetical protein